MRVLVIGIGSIARKHINVLRTLYPDIELIALRSSPASVSIPGIKDIYDFPVPSEDFDFVIISNPTSEHRETIIKSLSLRKPLFIEKPVLSSLYGVEEMLEMIEDSGIITYVACNLRFHPVVLSLREAVTKKRPLEYSSYCGSYLPSWRPESDYRNSYSAQLRLGGGVHLDLIHELDMCRFILGDPENVIKYYAKKSALEINSPDVAHYCLEYNDSSAFITLNYYRKVSRRDIELVWDDEIWYANLLKNEIVSSTGDVLHSEPYDVMNTYFDQMKYFLNAIKFDGILMNNASEAVETLRMTLYEQE